MIKRCTDKKLWRCTTFYKCKFNVAFSTFFNTLYVHSSNKQLIINYSIYIPKFLWSCSNRRVLFSIFSRIDCRRLIFSSPSSWAAMRACCIRAKLRAFFVGLSLPMLLHNFEWCSASLTRAAWYTLISYNITKHCSSKILPK